MIKGIEINHLANNSAPIDQIYHFLKSTCAIIEIEGKLSIEINGQKMILTKEKK